MKYVVTSVVMAALCLGLAACGSEAEQPAATPASTGVPQGSSGPGEVKVSSDFEAGGIDALFETATEGGLECKGVEKTSAQTHEVWVCDSVLLLAHFSDSAPLEGYVEGYLEKGQDVIRGESWFIAGRPERVESLAATFTD